ncbi:unnamed protein product, partial [Ascophyllum nodosum]
LSLCEPCLDSGVCSTPATTSWEEGKRGGGHVPRRPQSACGGVLGQQDERGNCSAERRSGGGSRAQRWRRHRAQGKAEGGEAGSIAGGDDEIGDFKGVTWFVKSTVWI